MYLCSGAGYHLPACGGTCGGMDDQSNAVEDAATMRVYEVLVQSYGFTQSKRTEAEARRLARAALAAAEEQP